MKPFGLCAVSTDENVLIYVNVRLLEENIKSHEIGCCDGKRELGLLLDGYNDDALCPANQKVSYFFEAKVTQYLVPTSFALALSELKTVFQRRKRTAQITMGIIF